LCDPFRSPDAPRFFFPAFCLTILASYCVFPLPTELLVRPVVLFGIFFHFFYAGPPDDWTITTRSTARFFLGLCLCCAPCRRGVRLLLLTCYLSVSDSFLFWTVSTPGHIFSQFPCFFFGHSFPLYPSSRVFFFWMVLCFCCFFVFLNAAPFVFKGFFGSYLVGHTTGSFSQIFSLNDFFPWGKSFFSLRESVIPLFLCLCYAPKESPPFF